MERKSEDWACLFLKVIMVLLALIPFTALSDKAKLLSLTNKTRGVET